MLYLCYQLSLPIIVHDADILYINVYNYTNYIPTYSLYIIYNPWRSRPTGADHHDSVFFAS